MHPVLKYVCPLSPQTGSQIRGQGLSNGNVNNKIYHMNKKEEIEGHAL